MSTTTDSRVIEMRFDNKEFEANAQETLKTLQELKRALDENLSGEAFDSIDRAAKNVDLSGISAGIEQLTDRFSTMGIVGMRVIENITDALMNKLTSAVSSVFSKITEGGLNRARNIENARFQLEGLLETEEEVEAIMAQAGESVNGTAYSYDSAAKAASMFAATGLRAGTEMETALKAIAGVAATTNSNYDDMAHIFTTVSGQGKVMTDQLNQLANRGLNGAAALATYFNKVADGSIDASDHVKQLLANIGATGKGIDLAATEGADAVTESYEEATKAYQKALKDRQKIYNQEYKDLQKTLNNEYTIKKKSYDAQYKELQKSLDAEIKAVQEANQETLESVRDRYTTEINAAREATSEKIKLINQEYMENLKLIDEERYNKLKAIDDEIDAIHKQAEEEEKARRKKEREDTLAAYEEAINNAQTISYREKLQEELADYRQQLAEEDLEEQRQERIKNLNEEKKQINEEYDEKKKLESDRVTSRIEQVQKEGQETVEQLQKQYDAEMKALRESQSAQLEELQNAKAQKLEALRESQSNELNAMKEAQNLQLESLRESQNAQLESFKEGEQEKLEALKEATKNGLKALKSFEAGMDFDEAVIREMVTAGLIDFETFSEAMGVTFGDHAKDANKTFSGSLANIGAALSRIGELFYAPFLKENGEMVELFNAIRIKVNEFKDALIGPGGLSGAAGVITSTLLTYVVKIKDWVESLDLSFRYMSINANDNIHVYNILTTLASTLSNVFKGLIDIFVAIGSYIKPIIQAFNDFFDINWMGILNISKGFRDFTRNLKASEKTVEVIYRLFYFLFDIIYNVVHNGFELLGGILPTVIGALQWLGETALNAVLYLFNLIDFAIDWVKHSEKVQKAIVAIKDAIDGLMQSLKDLYKRIKNNVKLGLLGVNIGIDFTHGFYSGMMSVVRTVVNAVWNFGKTILDTLRNVLDSHSDSKETKAIGYDTSHGWLTGFMSIVDAIYSTVRSVFENVLNVIKTVFETVDWEGMIGSVSNFVVNFITTISNGLSNGISWLFNHIDEFFKNVKAYINGEEFDDSPGWKIVFAIIDGVSAAVKALAEGIKNVALTLWNAIYEYFKDFSIQGAISSAGEFISTFFSTASDKVKEYGPKFGEALKNFFGNLEIGQVATMAAGVGIIFMIIKAVKSLAGWISPLEAFKNTLVGVKNALNAWSLDLKASAVLKIAGAVGILSLALVVLFEVFKDLDYGDKAAFFGIALLVESFVATLGLIVVGVTVAQSMLANISSASLEMGRAAKAIARGFGWKLVITALVEGLASVVVSIAALFALYKTDPDALKEAVKIVGEIGGVIAVITITVMSISAALSPQNAAGFAGVTIAFLALIAGILLMMHALEKLREINITKADIPALITLGVIIGLVGGLLAALSLTFGSGNGSAIAVTVGTAIAFCVLLIAAITALKKLIKEGITLQNSWPQLLVIGAIFIVLAAVMAIVNWSAKEGERSMAGLGSMLGIAAALMAAVWALKQLAEMPIEKYLPALAKLLGLFAIVGAVILVAVKSGSGEGSINAAYKSILGIAVLIGVLAIAVGAISMLDASAAWKATGILSTLLVALAAALAGAGTMSKSSITSFASILAMIGAIAIIGHLLLELSQYPWQSLLSAGGSIALVLVAFGISFNLISETKFNWGSFGMFITGILAIGLIAVIMGSLALNGGDWTTMLGLAGSIAACIVAMGIAINLMDGVKVSGGGFGTFAFGLIMIAVVGIIIAALSNITDWVGALSLAASISLVLLALAAAIDIMSIATFDKSLVGGMFMGLLAIIVIAGVLALFVNTIQVDVFTLLSFTTGISEVLLALAAALDIMSVATFDISLVGGMFMGLLAVIVIAGMLSLCVNGIETDLVTMLGFATAISEVLLAISVAILIMGLGGRINPSAMIAFAEATAAACAIAWGLENFSSGADPKELLALAIGVSIVLIALSVAVGILGILGGIAMGAIAGATALDAVILIIGGLLVGIGALFEKEPRLEQWIKDGGETLAGIGKAIGAFFGSIIEGFGEKILNLIPILGEKLSEFTTNAMPFFATLQMLGAQSGLADAAKAIAAVFLALGAAEIMSAFGAILDFFTGGSSFSTLGSQLAEFGMYMQMFYLNTRAIKDPESFKTIADATGHLIAMAGSIPNSGGWLGKVLGENDVDEFGKKLWKFSCYLPLIDMNFRMVTSMDKFNEVAEGMKGIISMATSLPNSGGWLGDVLGNNDIDDFGFRLWKFSSYMPLICANLNSKMVDLSRFGEIADGMRVMIEMATSIPNSGGWLGKIIGNNDIDDFGKKLKSFSESLAQVAKNFDGVDMGSIETMANSMRTMVFAAKTIKEQGLGEDGLLSKDNSLIHFGDALYDFSKKIRDMCDKNLMNIDNFARLMDALDRFTAMKTALTSFDPTGFVAFMTALETTGADSIKKFLEAFSGPNSVQIIDAITNLFNTIQNEFMNPLRAEMMRNLGRMLGIEIIQGMVDPKTVFTCSTVARELIDLIVKNMELAVVSSKTKLTTAGKAIASEFLMGMVDIQAMLLYKKATDEIVKLVSNGLNNSQYKSLVELAGTSNAISFATGLVNNKSKEAMMKAGTAYIMGLSKWMTHENNTKLLVTAGELDCVTFMSGWVDRDTLEKVKNFLHNFIDAISKILTPSGEGLVGGATNPFKTAGKEDSRTFASGFEVDDNIRNVIRNFVVEITNYLKGWEFRDQFRDAGKNAGYGFAEGLRDGDVGRSVRDAARDMAIDAYNSSKQALYERSPSKKMMEVGSFAGEGFVIGFSNWITAAAETGEEMGETAKDGLNEAISKIASEIQNEDQFNPTITPILDLSNIQDGMNQMDGMLNLDEPLRLAANAGMSFTGGVNDLLGGIQASIPSGSNADVVDAINQMRMDMSQMSAAIRQMQIVLDTGELVGAMTDPLDNSMGFNQILSERGVR